MGILDKLRDLTKPYDEDEDFIEEQQSTETQATQAPASHGSASPASGQQSSTGWRNPFADFGSSSDYSYEQPRKSSAAPGRSVSQSAADSKVVSIHSTAQPRVVVARPRDYGNSAGGIADHLIDGHTVVLNLEDASESDANRLLDFLSGVVFAQDGDIKRVSGKMCIITPCNVDLSGDVLEDIMDEIKTNSF